MVCAWLLRLYNDLVVILKNIRSNEEVHLNSPLKIFKKIFFIMFLAFI